MASVELPHRRHVYHSLAKFTGNKKGRQDYSFDLHAAKPSPIAEAALAHMARLYQLEAEAKEATPEERLALRSQSPKNWHTMPTWSYVGWQ